MENTAVVNNAQKKSGVSVGSIVLKVITYILLVAGAFLMVFPFLWMFFTSFKGSEELYQSVQLQLFPKAFVWDNYAYLLGLSAEWSKNGMLINNSAFAISYFVPGVGNRYTFMYNALLNTLIIEVSVIVVGTLTSTLAAFSFAKMKLRGKTFWLLFLMSGMMVPYAALMLPQYRVFQDIGWTGGRNETLLPLIIPGLFGNISMMFFLVQYMKGISSAFFEAAKIDGAGYLNMFFTIMLPMVKTAIAAQIIFWFVGIWNDYFAPSIYLKNKWLTLQPMLMLLNSSSSGDSANLNKVMAGSFLSSLPMLVIYITCQKFFIESLAISGVKG